MKQKKSNLTKLCFFLLISLLLFSIEFIKSKNKENGDSLVENTIEKEDATEAREDTELELAEPMRSAKYILNGKVTKVSDGDTFNILAELTDNEGKTEIKKIRIRSHGIDAPESKQTYGKQARDFLADQILNKEITVYAMGRDRYGRVIGVPFVDGKDINYEMIKSGCAWHYKKYDKSPSFIKYAKAEKEAREQKKGLWQNEAPIEPEKWRKNKMEKTKKS